MNTLPEMPWWQFALIMKLDERRFDQASARLPRTASALSDHEHQLEAVVEAELVAAEAVATAAERTGPH